MKEKFNGYGNFMDVNKRHLLLFRWLGQKALILKGFDTLSQLRDFISSSEEIVVIKRMEEGK